MRVGPSSRGSEGSDGGALEWHGPGEDRHPGQRDAHELGVGQPRLPATGVPVFFPFFFSQHCSKLPVPQDSAEMEDKRGADYSRRHLGSTWGLSLESKDLGSDLGLAAGG